MSLKYTAFVPIALLAHSLTSQSRLSLMSPHTVSATLPSALSRQPTGLPTRMQAVSNVLTLSLSKKKGLST